MKLEEAFSGVMTDLSKGTEDNLVKAVLLYLLSKTDDETDKFALLMDRLDLMEKRVRPRMMPSPS